MKNQIPFLWLRKQDVFTLVAAPPEVQNAPHPFIIALALLFVPSSFKSQSQVKTVEKKHLQKR